jgi:hypothetical protein
MSAWAGLYNRNLIDTTPGMSGPFAAPAEWTGHETSDRYQEVMRQAYAKDYAIRQQMLSVARHARLLVFTGPWSSEAMHIVKKLAKAKTRNKVRTGHRECPT